MPDYRSRCLDLRHTSDPQLPARTRIIHTGATFTLEAITRIEHAKIRKRDIVTYRLPSSGQGEVGAPSLSARQFPTGGERCEITAQAREQVAGG